MHGVSISAGVCCCLMAVACLRPPPPVPSAAATTPISSSPQQPPAAPPPPHDDPKTCIERSLDAAEKEAKVSPSSDSDRDALATELDRRIVELSAQIIACHAGSSATEAMQLEVAIGPDGAARAKVLGTSL